MLVLFYHATETDVAKSFQIENKFREDLFLKQKTKKIQEINHRNSITAKQS